MKKRRLHLSQSVRRLLWVRGRERFPCNEWMKSPRERKKESEVTCVRETRVSCDGVQVKGRELYSQVCPSKIVLFMNWLWNASRFAGSLFLAFTLLFLVVSRDHLLLILPHHLHVHHRFVKMLLDLWWRGDRAVRGRTWSKFKGKNTGEQEEGKWFVNSVHFIFKTRNFSTVFGDNKMMKEDRSVDKHLWWDLIPLCLHQQDHGMMIRRRRRDMNADDNHKSISLWMSRVCVKCFECRPHLQEKIFSWWWTRWHVIFSLSITFLSWTCMWKWCFSSASFFSAAKISFLGWR